MFHFKDVLESYTLFHRYGIFWGEKQNKNPKTQPSLGRNFCLLSRANAAFATIYFLHQPGAQVVTCTLTALLSDQSPVNFHSFLWSCSPSLPEMLDAPAGGQGRGFCQHVWAFARAVLGVQGFCFNWHVPLCVLTTPTVLPFQFSITCVRYLLQLLIWRKKWGGFEPDCML